MRPGIIRDELDRGFESLDGGVEVSGIELREAGVKCERRRLNIGFFLVQPRRLLKLDARRFHIALLSERRAERVMNLRSVRRNFEGLAKHGYGGIEVALLLPHGAERILRFSIIG